MVATARLLDPDTVRAIATALDALDVETLRARFDPDAMAAVDTDRRER